MFFKNNLDQSSNTFEQRFTIGFNGGCSLAQGVNFKHYKVMSMVLESFKESNKGDGLFVGMQAGFDREMKRIEKLRLQQLKQVQSKGPNKPDALER